MDEDDCKFVEIDGQYLEGGGQILRNALSFSAILNRPVRIINIRANRPNPGLSHQHLSCIRLLRQITICNVQGDDLKSTMVEYMPQKIKAGDYFMNTKTAASLSLIIQCTLPVLIFAGKSSRLELAGGTNVDMAPQVDFMTEVLLPNLEQFGASFDFDLINRGYYPRGGGYCKLFIVPVEKLKPVKMTNFGLPTAVRGWCFAAGRYHLADAELIRDAAAFELSAKNIENDLLAYEELPQVAQDTEAGCILKVTTTTECVIGASSLAGRKMDHMKLGSKPAQEISDLLTDRICVDSYVQDQLIIYMALAAGESKIMTTQLTNHTRAAIYVAEKMSGAKFKTKKYGKHKVLLTCQGIGHRFKP